MIRHLGSAIALGAVAALAAALISCDRFPQFEKIGVGLSDGELQIHYVGCEDEVVRTVRLSVPDDPDTDANERVVLWQIDSPSGSDRETYTVGETPRGFQETVAFEEEIDANALLLAGVETAGTGTARSFRMADLQEGMIWARQQEPAGNASPEVFRQRAASTCPGA